MLGVTDLKNSCILVICTKLNSCDKWRLNGFYLRKMFWFLFRKFWNFPNLRVANRNLDWWKGDGSINVHMDIDWWWLKCPCLSTWGGWVVNKGQNIVHVVCEWPLIERHALHTLAIFGNLSWKNYSILKPNILKTTIYVRICCVQPKK